MFWVLVAVQEFIIEPGASDCAPIDIAARALREGGLVIFPTETFYGLAADPRNTAAVERLFKVKRRSKDLALPLIATDTAQVKDVGTLTPLGRELAEQFWPGPLTLIVEATSSVDPLVLGFGKSVAVRVPNHAVACALAGAFGYPLTATSANYSGNLAATAANEVVDSFKLDVDVLLDAGRTPGGMASTIVDVRGTEPILVRPGSVPWGRVLQSLA